MKHLARRERPSVTAEHSDEIGFLNLAVFNMPVCVMSDELKESFYEGDLPFILFFHPGGWNRKQVRIFWKRSSKDTGPSIHTEKDPPVSL